jgi:Holliday junction resolvase RusA-like endonuclease
MSIRIVVYGSPAPQGSKSFKGLAKSGRAILAESSKEVRPWRQDVKMAAEQLRAELGLAVLDEPLLVRMTFTLPKPLSAPKRRVVFPSKLPDLSKLVRSAAYTLRMEHGFYGEGGLGRVYAQSGKGFMRSAAQNWDFIVDTVAKDVKERIK